MSRSIVNRVAASSALAVFAGVLLVMHWAPASAAAGGASPMRLTPRGQEKTADQAHKNIQVLKGLPDTEFSGVMGFMAAALGVNCGHCHVEGAKIQDWPFEKDDKPAKQIARKMIRMVQALNRDSFGGANVVNCATCHRGHPRPVSVPPVDQVALRKSNSEGSQPASEVSLPSADQIFDKYIEAIGGKAAVDGLQTQVVTSTVDLGNGSTLTQETYRKAPDKLMVISRRSGQILSEGYDGAAGWFKTPQGIADRTGNDLIQLRRVADFRGSITLRGLYSHANVSGKERVGEREAYVVDATTREGQTERLYFDVITGLLARKYSEVKTAFGPIPDESVYDDYKAVDGIRMPFVVHRTSQWANVTRRVTQAKHNTQVEDSLFNKPAPDR